MNGWPLQLLAVACLSLAAKMEERLVPSLLDLQVLSLFKIMDFTKGTIILKLLKFFGINLSFDHYRLKMQNLFLNQELSKEWNFLFYES